MTQNARICHALRSFEKTEILHGSCTHLSVQNKMHSKTMIQSYEITVTDPKSSQPGNLQKRSVQRSPYVNGLGESFSSSDQQLEGEAKTDNQ